MTLRCAFTLLAGLALVAADDQPLPPPAVLEPYIDDGHFQPDDYGWLRGAFADASEAEMAAHREITEWRRNCFAQALHGLRADLAELGYPDAQIQGVGNAPILCRESGQVPRLSRMESFADFARELDQARPVIETYLFAVRTAEQVTQPAGGPSLRAQLEQRIVGEQMLRRALFWGQGMAAEAPPLSPDGRAIAQAMIAAAMARRDHDNTEWLKAIISEHGWPKISEVGNTAAINAWLLAQHADADPVFQLEVLRLMEPLVAETEVRPQDYAYLYDRIMLKLSGRQRFGSQIGCPAGKYEPLPLEDEANVDALRAEMGMGPVSDYIQSMLASNGPCAPPPVPTQEQN